MRVNVAGVKKAAVRGEFIRLDALLKYICVASTGGEAKLLIQEGLVRVNAEVCTQRGRKVRPGDVVRAGGAVYKITARQESP